MTEKLPPQAVRTPADERNAITTDLTRLAEEIRPLDAAVATLLTRLSDAVAARRGDEVRAYAAALDARAVAEALEDRPSALWGAFDVVRNVLIFMPIAVTWYGLATASSAYAQLLTKQPEISNLPFLLLWEEAFRGIAPVLSFSTLATIDASLIGLLIVLSLVIHVRTDLRGTAARSRVLLRESEVRLLVGHALSVPADDMVGGEPSELLDQMIAEERRIFERGLEREQRLFDLETAVRELREAARDLARAADVMKERR